MPGPGEAAFERKELWAVGWTSSLFSALPSCRGNRGGADLPPDLTDQSVPRDTTFKLASAQTSSGMGPHEGQSSDSLQDCKGDKGGCENDGEGEGS